MPAGMIGRSALLIIASYACRNETEPAQGRSALGELLGGPAQDTLARRHLFLVSGNVVNVGRQ